MIRNESVEYNYINLKKIIAYWKTIDGRRDPSGGAIGSEIARIDMRDDAQTYWRYVKRSIAYIVREGAAKAPPLGSLRPSKD